MTHLAMQEALDGSAVHLLSRLPTTTNGSGNDRQRRAGLMLGRKQ